MASSSEGSSRNRIVIACDATKNRDFHEFKDIIHNIRIRGDIMQEGDRVTVLGVLHKVLHPMGFQIQIGSESFVGAHIRAIEEEVSRKADAYMSMLQHSAQECEIEGVDIEVKIVVGSPLKKVLIQELVASKASWAILDRQLRKDLKFYLRHVPCKVAVVYDNLPLEVLRPYFLDESIETIMHKVLYSLSKLVVVPPPMENETDSVDSLVTGSPKSSDVSKNVLILSPTLYSKDHGNEKSLQDELVSVPQQDLSGGNNKPKREFVHSPEEALQHRSEMPVVCTASEMKIDMNLKRFSYSEIQIATDDFSFDNLLGGGGYGVVYKGRFEDGKLVAIKMHKEANTQECAEFQSRLYGLWFARHKNIEMFLGYCCKEEVKILVYEYVCNRSLEWHLFDNLEQSLEWHLRYAIAVGAAQGLRFLHEAGLGSPIVHQNIKPSNILLTQDFVPLLGDCGICKWKINKLDTEAKILDNLAYLAPEYAENGTCSVKTDVYALGIVIIQLISGRKAVDSTRYDHEQSLREWALPLIETLAFDELIDPRLRDSYTAYELYNMARAARLCIQIESEMRPTIAEVLHLLEGENDHLRHVKSNLYPVMLSTEAS